MKVFVCLLFCLPFGCSSDEDDVAYQSRNWTGKIVRLDGRYLVLGAADLMPHQVQARFACTVEGLPHVDDACVGVRVPRCQNEDVSAARVIVTEGYSERLEW
jgi:hypothetical protein